MFFKINNFIGSGLFILFSSLFTLIFLLFSIIIKFFLASFLFELFIYFINEKKINIISDYLNKKFAPKWQERFIFGIFLFGIFFDWMIIFLLFAIAFFAFYLNKNNE